MRSIVCISLLAVVLAPVASADLTHVLLADDAGSGTDAPELPSGRVVVEPGRLYHGAIQGPHGASTLDPWDLYTVHLREGQTIDVWARGAGLLLSIRNDANETVTTDATTAFIAMLGLEYTAPADGRYHIDIQGSPQPYCFGFSLDGGPHARPPVEGALACSAGVDERV